MKSHGLALSAEMVRAMLAGLKTETRWLGIRTIEAGDTIWVREALRIEAAHIAYTADGTHALWEGGRRVWRWKRDQLPGVHMPRWAARIQKVVTGVRIERLQDITEAGAIAEGIESHIDDGVTYYGPFGKGTACPIAAYRCLWESLHCPGSWDANPEVQVISWAELAS